VSRRASDAARQALPQFTRISHRPARKQAHAPSAGVVMFPLAHLGIGSAIARVLPVKLPFGWVLLGTILPDLIDKPIFFLLSRCFPEAGWEAGKRGFAHTLMFLLLLAALSRWRKSLILWAVTAGTATHLVLDVISKSTEGGATALGSLRVLFWPFAGWAFPTLSHGMHGLEIWAFELIGLGLLGLQFSMSRSVK
jgi:branched-subunit amino acid transport protein AzlD